jgi:pilus assembly protein Flp/PilA
LGQTTYGLTRTVTGTVVGQFKRRKGEKPVNIVSLVMRVVDPVREFWHRREEEGASLVEYALLLALIAVIAIVALAFLGHSVSNTLNSVGQSINNP